MLLFPVARSLFCFDFIKVCAMCSPFAGYNEVVRIPSGATNIDVRQHSYSGKPEDDNYLGKLQTAVALSSHLTS